MSCELPTRRHDAWGPGKHKGAGPEPAPLSNPPDPQVRRRCLCVLAPEPAGRAAVRPVDVAGERRDAGVGASDPEQLRGAGLRLHLDRVACPPSRDRQGQTARRRC